MKKKIIVVLVLVIALLSAIVIYANSGSDEVFVAIDGEVVVFADQQPIIIDGQTFAPPHDVFVELGILAAQDVEIFPLRAFAEAAGYFVEWLPNDNTVAIHTSPLVARFLNLPPKGGLIATRDEVLATVPDYLAQGRIVFASHTRPSENIMAGWDNIATNSEVRGLIFDGLGTMERNMQGQWFANPVVNAEPIQITDNEDGSRTYTFTIHTANQFSDGRFITAHDYVGWAALRTHSDYGLAFPNNSGFGVYTNLRLYSDSQFSVTVGAEHLPYVWEEAIFMNLSPYPLHALIPGFDTQAQIVDNGDGVEIVGLSYRLLEIGIYGGTYGDITVDVGFRHHPTVSVGPYQFEFFDHYWGDIFLIANPYFPATWDGHRPRIHTIIFHRSDTVSEDIIWGVADIAVGMTGGWQIDELLSFTEQYSHNRRYESYTRNGFSLIRFHVDHGPTQFTEVRQAMAWIVDRELYLDVLIGGRGEIIHGNYAPAQWFVQEARERGMYDLLTQYYFNPQQAIEILEAGGWVLNAQGQPFVTGVDDVRYKDVSDITQSTYDMKFNDDPAVNALGLMRLELQWAAPNNNFFADEFIFSLLPAAAEIGISIVPTFFDNHLPLISRSTNWQAEFHMFQQGTTFGAVYAPWYTYDPLNFYASNLNFTSDPEILAAANAMRTIDISTEQGRSDFVDAFIEYTVIANREVLDLPFIADTVFDFIPSNLRNWHNSSNWGFRNAIVRAYLEDDMPVQTVLQTPSTPDIDWDIVDWDNSINLVSSVFASPNMIAGWDNFTPNVQARQLMFDGLGTIAMDKGGRWFENPVVNAEPIVVTDNPDGSRTYTFTLNPEMRFSDGRYITAHDYVGWIALLGHPYYWHLAINPANFWYILGWDEYIWNGVDSISGVRLLGEHQFSVTIVPFALPYVWEMPLFMNFSPMPLHAMLTDFDTQTSVVDDGDGVRILGLDPSMVDIGINGEIYGEGFRFVPSVTVGPYQFTGYIEEIGVIVLEINPYFIGTWDGYLPRIQNIIFTNAPTFVMPDVLAVGEADMLVAPFGSGWVINEIFEFVLPAGEHTFVNYPRNGYGLIRFHVDHGPTQFVEVRQAVKWLIDRNEFMEQFTWGHGLVPEASYGLAYWFTQEAIARGLHERITLYTFNPEQAVRVLEEGGWVLNAQGQPFRPNIDDVRYKDVTAVVQLPNALPFADDPDVVEVNGRLLMRLELQWATWHPGTNSMSDIIEILILPETQTVSLIITPNYMVNPLAELTRPDWDFDQRFHMFNQGLTFAQLYVPWYTYNEFLHGTHNLNFTSDFEIFALAELMRNIDPFSPYADDLIVETFMDLMVLLNEQVLDIPLYTDMLYDFIPIWLQNYDNNAIWGFVNAIQRAYISR